VFGVRFGEPRTGVRGWVLFVARAFQPEHIADSDACWCVLVCVGVWGVWGVWGVSPPHPRPLSPVSRGRGEDCVFFGF